ncbi:dienelactone hydrolase family protein [uncultured Serinicoccus sp.]|uniref:dienelactone hydrolase family protein n=1 Tax=uncultured Serinicoccus sp. TaxID=735514 RepID=UPI002603D8EE|nr:dienelactone hydrolase family protein [uncultured Serinicoccus sp.]
MSTPDVITLPRPDGDLPVHRFRPAEPSGAGIVLVQEIFGVSSYVRDRARDLAEQGYEVHVPELYWRIPDHEVDEGGEGMLERGMELMAATDWDDAVGDTLATVEHLRGELAGRVGLVGFCYGGGVAFATAARTEVDALVSYYGSALPQLLELAPQVTAPSLHHWGTEDAFIPRATVEEIERALDRDGVEFVRHEGAGHAFDNPHPAFHHAEASAAAWPRTLAFLAAHLRG